MNELSKVVNAQLQQAAENLVRNRLMSDEFLDFVQENTKPLDTLMAYYKCAIMEVETKFKVLNEQFSLEYDRNPIESIKTRVKSLDGIVRKVRRKNIPLTLSAIEQNINDIAGIRVVCSFPEDIYLLMSDEFLDFVQENTKPLDTLMAYYKCAIMEVETKFKVLNEQFSLEYDRNPIESIKTRVKSLDGIVRKVRRKNIPLTLSAIEQNINDIAGIRVVCSFPEDIYLLADCLLQQDDIRLIEQKDYIKHPKENGYRSLHLIVAVPIFLQNEKREMKVEVQLRTIAMDFWASLEHKVRYKKNVPADETERLAQELSECAQISADLDQRMQNIRTRLADAELQHPQKQKKDEQILLDVLGL